MVGCLVVALNVSDGDCLVCLVFVGAVAVVDVDCLVCFVFVGAVAVVDGDCLLCFVFLCFEDFLCGFCDVVAVCVEGCFF